MKKKHLHLRLQSISQNVRKSKMFKEDLTVPVSRASAWSVVALTLMCLYSLVTI